MGENQGTTKVPNSNTWQRPYSSCPNPMLIPPQIIHGGLSYGSSGHGTGFSVDSALLALYLQHTSESKFHTGVGAVDAVENTNYNPTRHKRRYLHGFAC